VSDIIKEHRTDKELDILDVACGTGNVVLECASCLRHASFDHTDVDRLEVSLGNS